MTTAQRIMLFKLFTRGCEARGISGVTARDLERERITVEVFSVGRSWSKFNNADVDRMKAALLAIINPTDLDAQLKQINMPRARLLYGLRQVADRAYVAAISADKFGTRDYESLPDDQLSALHMTVCNRAKSRLALAKSDALVVAEDADIPF